MSENKDESEYILGGMAVKCGILTQEQYEQSYYDHVENPGTPYRTFLLQNNYLSEEQMEYVDQMVQEYYKRKGETEVPQEPQQAAPDSGEGGQIGIEGGEPEAGETSGFPEPSVEMSGEARSPAEEETDDGADFLAGFEGDEDGPAIDTSDTLEPEGLMADDSSDDGGLPQMKTLSATTDTGEEAADVPEPSVQEEPAAPQPREHEEPAAPQPPAEEEAAPQPPAQDEPEAAEPPADDDSALPKTPEAEESAAPEPPANADEDQETLLPDMDTPAEGIPVEAEAADSADTAEASVSEDTESGIDFDADTDDAGEEPSQEAAAEKSDFPEPGREPVTAEITVSNWQKKLGGASEEVTVEAAVSTGSTDLALPADIIEKLGLEEIGEVEVSVSDGSRRKCRIYGIAELEVQGRTCHVRAVELPRDSKPLLGAVPLQEMDFHILMSERKLTPNPDSRNVPLIYLY